MHALNWLLSDCSYELLHDTVRMLVMQNAMGPYTIYGLAGAGAGLLFYFAAGRQGGPVAIPGSGSENS